MSDVTKLAKGEISPADFAAKVAGELKASPLAAMAGSWILDQLFALLDRKLGSSTIAHVVTAMVKEQLQGALAPAI